jgi:hypothetical protein
MMDLVEADSEGKQEGGFKAKVDNLTYGVIMPFMDPFLEINIAPYYIADYRQLLKDVIRDERKIEARYVEGYKSKTAKRSARLGVAAGVTGVVAQAAIYTALCGLGYSGVLFIPATTNLCSVINEACSWDKDRSIDSKL